MASTSFATPPSHPDGTPKYSAVTERRKENLKSLPPPSPGGHHGERGIVRHATFSSSRFTLLLHKSGGPGQDSWRRTDARTKATDFAGGKARKSRRRAGGSTRRPTSGRAAKRGRPSIAAFAHPPRALDPLLPFFSSPLLSALFSSHLHLSLTHSTHPTRLHDARFRLRPRCHHSYVFNLIPPDPY